jgi:MFS family permease
MLGPLLLGASLAGFAYSRSLGLSLVLLAAAGFASMSLIATSNTLIQTLVHDSKRGRVMSFYTICFMGMGPFGSLIAGRLASRMGAPAAVAVSAACSLAAAMLFVSQLPMLRRHMGEAGDEMNPAPAGGAASAK